MKQAVQLSIVAGLTLAVALPALPAGDKKAGGTKTTFEAHLKSKFPGKTWQLGPKQLESPELARAYPSLEAWFVHSSPPLPPGAPLPDLLKAYEERVKEYREKQISVSALIDKEGKIHSVKTPADFNQGLMPVKNEEEIKIAAAAVLSLAAQERTAPGVVAAKEIQVMKTDKGWTATATRKFNFQGTVQFNAKGEVTAVSKLSIAPLPP